MTYKPFTSTGTAVAVAATQAAARAAIGAAYVADVRFFGAIGGSNDSAAFQDAIDTVAAAGGGSVYVPAGVWHADGLLLRTGVFLDGDGPEQSRILAVAGSSNSFVVGIDHGITQYAGLRNIGIEANGNASQHGFYAYARRTGGDTASGLWKAEFINLRIYNFAGAQMWLRGGGTSSLDPIQFFKCEDVILERQYASASSCGLLMSGQVNQSTWTGGRIDAFGASHAEAPGLNIKICRELSAYDVTFDNSTTYASTKAPHTHAFMGLTTQQAQLAAYIETASSITFDTIDIEQCSSGVLAANGATVRVDRSHFANSGMSALSGHTNAFTVKALSAANVKGDGNTFIGTYGRMSDSDGGSATCKLRNSLGSTVASFNTTRQITAAATFDTGLAETIEVTGSATAIQTITSRLMANEQITLRAITSTFKLASGGNIDLTGLPDPLVIDVGKQITLVRYDRNLSGWAVVNSGLFNRARRVVAVTLSATPTINLDVTDVAVISPMGAAITGITITGTPNPEQRLAIVFKDDGTARAIAHGSSFQAGPSGLLTTTSIGKWHRALYVYDSNVAKLVCLAADATGY